MTTEYHIRVWGPRAAFVDPDYTSTASRTYPTIPPTAARGVLEAIFWQREHGTTAHEPPAFDWIVKRVATCRPVEVAYSMVNERKDGKPRQNEYVTTQRMRAYLADVEYVITAELRVRKPEHAGKYHAKFQKLAAEGASRTAICLGQREYRARYELVEESQIKPIAWNTEILMTLWTYPNNVPTSVRNKVVKVVNGVYKC